VSSSRCGKGQTETVGQKSREKATGGRCSVRPGPRGMLGAHLTGRRPRQRLGRDPVRPARRTPRRRAHQDETGGAGAFGTRGPGAPPPGGRRARESRRRGGSQASTLALSRPPGDGGGIHRGGLAGAEEQRLAAPFPSLPRPEAAAPGFRQIPLSTTSRVKTSRLPHLAPSMAPRLPPLEPLTAPQVGGQLP
jgi:hypothetical protein